jgi:aryl-alcohol dehydrogenase-like predicted oxidoreductase
MPKGTRVDLEGLNWLKEQFESKQGQEKIEKVRRLTPLAQELGCSMAQLALAWCLKNPHVSTVITGASRAEQVTQNMKALDVVPALTGEVMERIEGILQNKPDPIPDYRE